MSKTQDTSPEVTGRPTVTGCQRRDDVGISPRRAGYVPGQVMRRIFKIAAVPAAVVLLAAVLLATHLVTVDWLPALHTYGLSFGTNYHYCSVDLVGGHLAAGCQSAH